MSRSSSSNPNRNCSIASPAPVYKHVPSTPPLMSASLVGTVEWVEKLHAPNFRQMFHSEIEEFCKERFTEDYYEGDESEYEERYLRSLLAQMHQWVKSNIKINYEQKSKHEDGYQDEEEDGENGA